MIVQAKALPLRPGPRRGVVVQQHGLQGRRRALSDHLFDPRRHEAAEAAAALLSEHIEADHERVCGERGLVDQGYRDHAALVLTDQLAVEPDEALEPAPE